MLSASDSELTGGGCCFRPPWRRRRRGPRRCSASPSRCRRCRRSARRNRQQQTRTLAVERVRASGECERERARQGMDDGLPAIGRTEERTTDDDQKSGVRTRARAPRGLCVRVRLCTWVRVCVCVRVVVQIGNDTQTQRQTHKKKRGKRNREK